jgi:hypothetical protein
MALIDPCVDGRSSIQLANGWLNIEPHNPTFETGRASRISLKNQRIMSHPITSVRFAEAIPAPSALRPEASKALINFLGTPEAAVVIKTMGMEPS